MIIRACNGGVHTFARLSYRSTPRESATPSEKLREREHCSSLLSAVVTSILSFLSHFFFFFILLALPIPTFAVIEVGTKPVGKFQLSLPSSSTHPEKPIAGVSPRDNGENEHCHPPLPPLCDSSSLSLSLYRRDPPASRRRFWGELYLTGDNYR